MLWAVQIGMFCARLILASGQKLVKVTTALSHVAHGPRKAQVTAAQVQRTS